MAATMKFDLKFLMKNSLIYVGVFFFFFFQWKSEKSERINANSCFSLMTLAIQLLMLMCYGAETWEGGNAISGSCSFPGLALASSPGTGAGSGCLSLSETRCFSRAHPLSLTFWWTSWLLFFNANFFWGTSWRWSPSWLVAVAAGDECLLWDLGNPFCILCSHRLPRCGHFDFRWCLFK